MIENSGHHFRHMTPETTLSLFRLVVRMRRSFGKNRSVATPAGPFTCCFRFQFVRARTFMRCRVAAQAVCLADQRALRLRQSLIFVARAFRAAVRKEVSGPRAAIDYNQRLIEVVITAAGPEPMRGIEYRKQRL